MAATITDLPNQELTLERVIQLGHGLQNGAMTSATASKPIAPRLAGMVAGIRQLIPAANVRLYSWGEACG
ncbi:MAG: hypothetical protein NTW83_11855 [Cyanobacteria bacterium]|nr:hypothetical protein [Cyanobacteriota bacterium]